tara:strand:- start:18500 stop:18640 length:141 start_codon:yes stop_codon:yes gene_type:complete
MINLKLDDTADLLIIKSALVNFKKAPFLSKQEIALIDKLLDKINEL